MRKFMPPPVRIRNVASLSQRKDCQHALKCILKHFFKLHFNFRFVCKHSLHSFGAILGAIKIEKSHLREGGVYGCIRTQRVRMYIHVCSILLFDSHFPNSLLWYAFSSSIWYCCSMLLHSSAQSVDRQPRDRGRLLETELPAASSQFSVQFSLSTCQGKRLTACLVGLSWPEGVRSRCEWRLMSCRQVFSTQNP